MIGIEQAFFISLLGLRPGLFRCQTDLTDGTDFSGTRKNIYVTQTFTEITEKTLSPSRDGLVTVLITMLLKVESSILLSPIQCILLH